MATAAIDATEIEVGAIVNEGLRYWRAKEAVRVAELRLTAQASAKQAFETRTTALLGWIVAACAALAAWLAATETPLRQKWPALAIFLVLFGAAFSCIMIIWPAFWAHPGYEPDLLTESGLGTELEELESMAAGYAGAIDKNERSLRRAARLIRFGFCAIGLAPFVGAAGLIILAVV